MPNLLRSLSLFNRPIRKNRQFMHQSHQECPEFGGQYNSFRNILKSLVPSLDPQKAHYRGPRDQKALDLKFSRRLLRQSDADFKKSSLR